MDKHLHLLRPFSLKDGEGPAYRQLGHFLEELRKSGLLVPGDRLPAERETAAATNLSRTTVAAAYAELVTRGLAETRIGKGTFVSGTAPSTSPACAPPWAHPAAVTLDQVLSLSTGSCEPEDAIISFVVGAPAPELTPSDFSQALADILDRHDGGLPPHTAPEGLFDLRDGLAKWTGASSGESAADAILVTTGSQQALYLVAQTLIQPGDAVMVERPTFFGALQLFKALGAYLVEFDLQKTQGQLINQLKKHKPKLIYVNPTFQNPSGSVLDLIARHKLLELAQELDVPIIDDDPYRELWFECPPPPRLQELAHRSSKGMVITLGTVSKLLTPAVRLGWVMAKPPLMERLVRLKQVSDLHTSLLSQAVVLYYLRENRLSHRAQAMRQQYKERRNRLLRALQNELPQAQFTAPAGGFYVWCRLPGVNSVSLFPRALSHGVSFVPGPSFHAYGDGMEWLRLSFASPPAELIDEGVKRLARSVHDLKDC